MSDKSDKYHQSKCKDIVYLYSKAYNGNKLEYKDCIKKVNRKLINKIIIKIPNSNRITLNLDEFPNIQKTASFLLYNLDVKIFKKNYNSYAFDILWLLLDIFEQNKEKSKKLNKKDLFTDIVLFSDIIDYIQFGNYIFTIPGEYKVIFNVKGFNLAKLTLKKL